MSTGVLEIVSINLAGQKFCIDIMTIREIRGWVPVTPVPHQPDFVLGILNLRGAVIPVIDLSRRLGMKSGETTERSAIIVTDVDGMLAGLLVDQVSDMITIKLDDLQPPPEIIPKQQRDYCRGVVATGNEIVCVLNLAALAQEHRLEAA